MEIKCSKGVKAASRSSKSSREYQGKQLITAFELRRLQSAAGTPSGAAKGSPVDHRVFTRSSTRGSTMGTNRETTRGLPV